MKNCGTCQHATPYTMEEGALSEIRCDHPDVRNELCMVDWIEDGGYFPPTEHGQHCNGWSAKADRIAELEGVVEEYRRFAERLDLTIAFAQLSKLPK